MRKLTVCGRDIAEYAIVLNPIPAPAEKTAAEFLQDVIAKSCGVTLPIAEAAEYGIYIGTREADSRVKWDGFRMTTDEKNLYLDGNIPRGTLCAAYDFAEKYLGWRAFSFDLEVISTDGEADVPADTEYLDNPAFESRLHSWAGFLEHPAFASKSRITNYINESFGGVVPVGACHTFDLYCPTEVYFDEHPEYYALCNGERLRCGYGKSCGQLCLTNPDVLRIVTENVLQMLREHPEMKLIDCSQVDNSNYCQCEKCAAVDAEEGSHAGTMIRFINAVAEEVEKEFPDVLVQTFAYQYGRKAPKLTRVRDNVLIRYCTIEACFRHPITDPDCPLNKGVFADEIKEWGNICRQMSIWDYATNYSCFVTPFPNLIALRENIRYFADCHAIHLYEEDTSPGVNYAGSTYPELKAYLIRKLMWNPYMSDEEYDRHMNEFLAAFYGPGWKEMKAYVAFEHEMTANIHLKCFESVDISETHPGKEDEEWHEACDSFEPYAYQKPYPGSVLNGLAERVDEGDGYFDRAYALAETEQQRDNLRRNRMSLTFLRLFCTEHDKEQMSAEEQREYEAAVEQYLADRKKYRFFHNLRTAKRNH